MVEVIYDLKNQLLEEMERDVKERGVERLDKEKVDMVKDLAEAEKSCWEAEYYRAVAEAMEGGSGYGMQNGISGNQMGYNGMSGAQGGNRVGNGNRGGQNGSGSGYRDSMGRFAARRGYGYQQHIDALRMEMQNADPQQREQMMQELRGVMQQ